MTNVVHKSSLARLILLSLSTCWILLAACSPSPAPRTPGACAVPLELSNLHNRRFPDSQGALATMSSLGQIDPANAFFRDLGTNGRRCVSCHVPQAGWTITPAYLQDLFKRTNGGACDDGQGLTAVFRPLDGATSPTADVSTLEARQHAYALLLSRGLIRVGLPLPANAEFDLVSVEDPYGFANAAELSLFRRPLPTTNLKFDSAVMWDGRETVAGAPITADLTNQAATATITHARGLAPTLAQRTAIVSLETSLATAQVLDKDAGELGAGDALGGPAQILAQPFYIGINDDFGDPVTGEKFSPVVFSLYDAWSSATGDSSPARRAIARGQALFNGRTFAITGVSGINDEPAFGTPTSLVGTCGTCHDTPNAGNHSVSAPLDIGIASADLRTPDLPLYTFRNKTSGELRRLTDPGRALIDGKWAHLGRFKGPILRDLAVRAPYFHNGSAPDLASVVNFYNQRFAINLSAGEKADLAAFLGAL